MRTEQQYEDDSAARIERDRAHFRDLARGRAHWAEAELVGTPVSSRCWYYLHTTGGPRRCLVEPDYHDGPHDYDVAGRAVEIDDKCARPDDDGCTHDPCLSGLTGPDAPTGAGDDVEAYRG